MASGERTLVSPDAVGPHAPRSLKPLSWSEDAPAACASFRMQAMMMPPP